MNTEIKIAYIMSIICVLLLTISLSSASIDIYYPDNQTTDIWVANETNPGYDYYIGNSITDANYTSVILRNQINDSTNLIEDPITFVNTFVKIFYAVVFCFGIVVFAYIFKRVLK